MTSKKLSKEQFESALRETLEDLRVSRSERRAVRQLLDQADLSDDELPQFRHIAFELAKETLQGCPNHAAALEWLEEVIGLLQQPAATTGGQTEVLFAPSKAPQSRIRTLLQRSTKSIDICLFTIADNMLAEEIIKASKRGVPVRIVTDDRKSHDTGSDIERLQHAGIDVKFDCSVHHMHHKFAIFDGLTVVDGSYNWTRSAATRNQESLLVSTDHTLVRQYARRFEELWFAFKANCTAPEDGHADPE